MNYYILPKNNITINIAAEYCNTNFLEPYISHSLIRFFNHTKIQLCTLYSNTLIPNLGINLNQIINTHEFILTNIPNNNISVSKVKPESNIFFELLEIFHLFDITDIFLNNNSISTFHITPNYSSSLYLLNILREDKNDMHIGENPDIDILYNLLILDDCFNKKKELLFFEFNKEDYQDISLYFKNIILVLRIILKNQNYMGVTIIKIQNIFHKVIIDVLYIMSGLFEKVYIIKPSVCNNISNDRYIICKKYMPSDNINLTDIEFKLSSICNILENRDSNTTRKIIISSLLENEIPYYFINKIEESNIVIGQQQLEFIDQIINIIKNKNKDDKIENIKRQNIQKCIQWCEKYKIPHNKFIDKTNIFLNVRSLKNDDDINENNININHSIV